MSERSVFCVMGRESSSSSFLLFFAFLFFFSLQLLVIQCVEHLQDNSTTTSSSSSSSSFPQVLFQVGPPKSASTTQFVLLQAIAELRNPHYVMAGYIGGKTVSENRLSGVRKGFTLVAKTHHCPPITSHNRSLYPALVFSTESYPKRFCASGKEIPVVVQDPNIYFREGFPYLTHQIRKQYQPVFNLTEDEMTLLIDFMKKYEPVRRCCGNQMSTSFAKYLKALGIHDDSHSLTYNLQNKTFRDSHASSHYCADKNLTHLAYEYSETTMVKKYPGPLRIDYHFRCMAGEVMFRAGMDHKTPRPVDGQLKKVLNTGANKKKRETNGFSWFDDEEVFQALKEKYQTGSFGSYIIPKNK